MSVNKDTLFNGIDNGAAWDTGVVFNRTNPIPIDKYSVFKTKTDAEIYAETDPVAYPGQIISVIPEDINENTIEYVIQQDGTLKEIGSGLSDEDIANIKNEIIGDTESSSPQDNTILGAKAYTDQAVNNLTINWNAVVASQLQGTGDIEFTKFSIASMRISTGAGLLTIITENHSVYSFIIYCNLANGSYNYKIHQLYSKCDTVDDCLIMKISIPLDSTNRTHICLSVQSKTSMTNTAYRIHCSYTSLSNNLLDLKPINELTLPYSETLFSGDQGSPSFHLWESDGETPYNGAIYYTEFSNDIFNYAVERNVIGNVNDYFRGKSQYAERDSDGKTISTTYVKIGEGIGRDGSGVNAEIFNDYTNNTAIGKCSHSEGSSTAAGGYYSHAEGSNNTISEEGHSSHVEGYGNTITGSVAHAEGSSNTLQSSYSHVEGSSNILKNGSNYSHVEGYGNTLGERSTYSHIEGNNNTIDDNCMYVHLEGQNNLSPYGHNGNYSIVCAHAEGYRNCVLSYQHAQGHYNNYNTAAIGSKEGTEGTAFVIGNGNSSVNSNAFRICYNGDLYTPGTAYNSGADYAEYFEWKDGNPDNEDRRGYFVTMIDDKIAIATENDYILGIISGQPSIIGNGDEDWQGRYIHDEFGSYITETFEYEEDVKNEETGEIITVTKTGTKYKENPDYDPTRPYIQRKLRAEWDAVGMMGVLAVRDDGTCKINGYCKVTNNGIATTSDAGYRVIARVTNNIIKVILK